MFGELIFNIILLFFFCIMFFCSWQIEIWNDYAGARYWPMTLVAVAILLFIIRIIKIWYAISEEEKRKKAGDLLKVKPEEAKKMTEAFGVCLLYVLFLPAGGFLVSTFLFGACFAWILGADKPIKMVLSGLCSSLPIFMVFVWGLNIRLPRGAGVFYTISLWLERVWG